MVSVAVFNCYAECYYVALLTVIMLTVIRLNVVMLTVVAPK
jgi:hypothetical protein